MPEHASLPKTFDELLESPPDGFELSERLIDPLVVIGKIGTNRVARLAGVRLVNGRRDIYVAPTNNHAWVLDGTTIRPLPKDAVSHFKIILGGADASDISYSDAIRMFRSVTASMQVELDNDFLKAGREVAESLGVEIDIPNLAATLFPYQVRGVRWMSETINHTGGLILADEMGLGKTLQIIALLLLSPPLTSSPALIVCPTSLIANWIREIERFAPSLTLLVHRGPNRAGISRDLQTSNVVITTYDTMVNDIAIVSSFEWSWVICDEAQAIKNPDSNRRQAVARIPRRRSIPMTGTPVENSLVDLWSLADFAVPGLLGSRSDFEAEYPDTLESAQAVGRLTDPLILKRKVSEVADDLPERIDIDIPLELDSELAEHYVQVRNETLARYPVAGALVATLQLQLLCAHPWLRQTPLDHDGEDAMVERTKGIPLMTSKMEQAVMLLREAFFNGQKVIVFALFNRVGDLLREAFTGFPAAYWGAINGSTPAQDRQPLIDNFSAHAGPACLILNPKAAGAGLNITAATVVVHFTPVWNPALEAQASARAHRRGQTRPVTVYRLFYKDTVEEIMIGRALWKSELANDSVPMSSRTADDLRQALKILPKNP